jgi:hypothetical protein
MISVHFVREKGRISMVSSTGLEAKPPIDTYGVMGYADKVCLLHCIRDNGDDVGNLLIVSVQAICQAKLQC